MGISYYEDERHAPVRRMRLLPLILSVDLAIAMAALFMWTAVSLYIAEPLEWATWNAVRRGSSFLDLFDYPFVLLWAMPLSCIAGAWLARRMNKRALALTFAMFPVVVLGLIVAWYYLAPMEYR